MNGDAKSVLVCVPVYGQVYPQTMLSLVKLTRWLTLSGYVNDLVYLSIPNIVDARNLFYTIWLDHYQDMSHMLQVDADMGFEPELVRDMLYFDKPLTGTIYARRAIKARVVGQPGREIVKGFVSAKSIGAGVMLIERNAAAKLEVPIKEAVPPALQELVPQIKLPRLLQPFKPIEVEGRELFEDASFCHRWRTQGGEIWANVAHPISHVGPFDYRLRYQDYLEKVPQTVGAVQ
jgi:hypothetical protein